MKVVSVVGTRPEVIKLSRVIPALDRSFEHTLIHTGQNHDYGLKDVFFDEMDIRQPDISLNAVGSSTMDTIANMLLQIDNHLAAIQPDAVLILGDTNSCFATAYAAKRRHIVTFHMEAGNRCFDDRVPEEINRRAIDHISDINMPYSEAARTNLLREGLPPDRIIKTGSPMKEVLDYYQLQIANSDVLRRESLWPKEYFLVSCHREENLQDLSPLWTMLIGLEPYGLPVIMSTHPRLQRAAEGCEAARFCKPFGFFDYVKLQQNARCVLSDSGTITEESAILGFPALNIRETHERQEGMEEGAVMMTGFNFDRIQDGIKILGNRNPLTQPQVPEDYCVGNVSEKVVSIVLSYVNYVRRTVYGL